MQQNSIYGTVPVGGGLEGTGTFRRELGGRYPSTFSTPENSLSGYDTIVLGVRCCKCLSLTTVQRVAIPSSHRPFSTHDGMSRGYRLSRRTRCASDRGCISQAHRGCHVPLPCLSYARPASSARAWCRDGEASGAHRYGDSRSAPRLLPLGRLPLSCALPGWAATN
jgi:hypothetical protein